LVDPLLFFAFIYPLIVARRMQTIGMSWEEPHVFGLALT